MTVMCDAGRGSRLPKADARQAMVFATLGGENLDRPLWEAGDARKRRRRLV